MERKALFHDRPMCIAACGTLLGVLLGCALPERDCLLIGGVMLLLFALSIKFKKRRFALLFLLLSLALFRVLANAPAAVPSGTHTLSGAVAAVPKESASGDDIVVLDHLTFDNVPADGRVLAYLDLVLPPVPGQRLTFVGNVRAVDPENDYYRYLRVSAIVSAKDGSCEFSLPPGGATGIVNRVRAALKSRAVALFPEHGSLICAFLLGERDIETETYARFQAAGVGHLLAISGLHVSILAAAVCFCLRVLGLWTRFFLMFLFLLLYCILTSFAPSVVRASVMFLCGALAVPLKRTPDGASSLSAAFVLIVLFNPFALFYVGFQLSFLAAYGLVTLAPLIRKPLARLGSAAAGTIGGTLSATIGTLPAVGRFFGSVPVAAVFVNVLVLPLFSYMLVPAFAAIVLSYLSFPLGQGLAAAASFVLGGLLNVINACAGGHIAMPAPGFVAFFLWLLAMLAASKYVLRRGRTRLTASALLILLSLLVWRL